jgi:hypothetical protein
MSTIAIDNASPKWRIGRAARITTTAIAGLVAALFMYHEWRNSLQVPLELVVSVHMNDTGSAVRPWAPWWVPTGIMAMLSMLLWRAFAVRRSSVSIIGGTIAFIIVAILIFPVAGLCLELGAVAQYYPRPAMERILAILPLMIVGSIGNTMIYLFINGIVALPASALAGLLNAVVGKLILCLERWLNTA